MTQQRTGHGDPSLDRYARMLSRTLGAPIALVSLVEEGRQVFPGACLGSLVWFTGLGYGARLLAPLLARPRAWRLLDTAIGCVMLLVALRLAVG